MIDEIASRIWWRKFISSSARSWQELEEFPGLSPDRQRAQLANRLFAQIQYFGRREDALPEWRDAARISTPEELWREWPSLPVLDKKTIQTRYPPEEMRRRFGLEGIVKSTGGSTGEPTRIFHDPGMTHAGNAASTYTRLRMGWRPGMATIIVWGAERDVRKKQSLRSRVYVRLLRDIVIAGYELSESSVDRVLRLIRKHRPVAIQGFTSMLAFLAKAVLDRGESAPAGDVQLAWNGGEMLYPEQNEVFQQAFGVPILNRYGGRELSAMACQFRHGGPLHVLRPWLFLEIVDASGRPVREGEAGRLIWTSTICRGTPFLRYDIGDMGSFEAADESESGVSAIARLEGRTAGLLTLPDGRQISCLFWNHLFKEFDEVRQFQVVVRPDGRLEIRLNGTGMPERREARLRETLGSFLGATAFEISWVERIPLTRQGKLVQVVRDERMLVN